MSYTTNDTDIAAAINRSLSHNEIVTIRVRTKKAAWNLAWQLIDKFDTDVVDTGDTIEVWSMGTRAEWRVHVQCGGES